MDDTSSSLANAAPKGSPRAVNKAVSASPGVLEGYVTIIFLLLECLTSLLHTLIMDLLLSRRAQGHNVLPFLSFFSHADSQKSVPLLSV